MTTVFPLRARLLADARRLGLVWGAGAKLGYQPYPAYRVAIGALHVSKLHHPRLEAACWRAWMAGARLALPATLAGFPAVPWSESSVTLVPAEPTHFERSPTYFERAETLMSIGYSSWEAAGLAVNPKPPYHHPCEDCDGGHCDTCGKPTCRCEGGH